MNNLHQKDFSLFSGERQTASTVKEIRKDHTIRYDLAIQFIKDKGERFSSCLDIFCGNGYGTFMMSSQFPKIDFVAIDGSDEAISFAMEYYSNNNILFKHNIFPFDIQENKYDIITCFESLEHVEDDSFMLDLILSSLKSTGYLLLSIPNDDNHILDKNPHKFHYRHYKHSELISMIPSPFEIVNWFGQNIYEFSEDGINTFKLLDVTEMDLQEKKSGQVNLYIISRENLI